VARRREPAKKKLPLIQSLTSFLPDRVNLQWRVRSLEGRFRFGGHPNASMDQIRHIVFTLAALTLLVFTGLAATTVSAEIHGTAISATQQ
jgi:hypothetical protein